MIRQRFRSAQTLAILEGLEPVEGASGGPWSGKRLVISLSVTALLSGTAAQLCNELIFRADPDAGDTVSLVEYAYCALASAGALRVRPPPPARQSSPARVSSRPPLSCWRRSTRGGCRGRVTCSCGRRGCCTRS